MKEVPTHHASDSASLIVPAEARKADLAHEQRVHQALDALVDRVDRADGEGTADFDLRSGRLIIFSDQHRGARNGADDFRKAERTYNAALAYYYEMGHTLAVLGDVEELWEEFPHRVVQAYDHSLGLEAKFFALDRYLRFWGNHDDAWQHPELVRRHLFRFFPGINVQEALRLRVVDRGRSLGSLLLTHGHQGTAASDRYTRLSRFPVRYLWRNLQRLTRISLNTPARDWRLRERHNIALYRWATQQEGLVLIAGHTHRPVFKSRSHAAQVEDALRKARTLHRLEDTDAYRRRVADLAAELEWVRAQELHAPEGEGAIEMDIPCYFNTGCCCFLDGDITGIEVIDGEIRLVRWPDTEERPQPEVLARAALGETLKRLQRQKVPSFPNSLSTRTDDGLA